MSQNFFECNLISFLFQHSLHSKTALTTSNLAVTTAATEPTTATTTADSLVTEMVLTTSNLAMTAEINEQESRASKKLHYDETNNEVLQSFDCKHGSSGKREK